MLPENMVTLRSHLHLTNFYAYMFLPTLPAFMGSVSFYPGIAVSHCKTDSCIFYAVNRDTGSCFFLRYSVGVI